MKHEEAMLISRFTIIILVAWILALTVALDLALYDIATQDDRIAVLETKVEKLEVYAQHLPVFWDVFQPWSNANER